MSFDGKWNCLQGFLCDKMCNKTHAPNYIQAPFPIWEHTAEYLSRICCEDMYDLCNTLVVWHIANIYGTEDDTMDLEQSSLVLLSCAVSSEL